MSNPYESVEELVRANSQLIEKAAALERELKEAREECVRLKIQLGSAREASDDAHRANATLDSELSRLRAELEKRKLKWQKGKPPKPERYWVKTKSTYYFDGGPYLATYKEGFFLSGSVSISNCEFTSWAGPIEPPEES